MLLFVSCGKKNRFAIDTSRDRIEVKVKRFDLDLIRMDTTRISTSVETLSATYPEFLPLFIRHVTNTSIEDKDTIASLLGDFVMSPLVKDVNEKVIAEFSDISNMEREFSDAYTYLHHYFPNLTLPEIYFYVSGFFTPMMINPQRTILGTATDYYLGADFEPYKNMFYEYMLQNMRKEQLPIDILSALIQRNFQFDATQNRLLDNMLYRGKCLFLLSIILPDRTTNEILGYSTEQWQWAETHETQIWQTIIGQKDLFSSDLQLINKYLNDAPFTTPISQDSPGRLGAWVGYRIVDSFMRKDKAVTLPELMRMNDYQKLLEKSGYNS